MHPELVDFHLRRTLDPYTWARWRDSKYEYPCILPAQNTLARHRTIPYIQKESTGQELPAAGPPPTSTFAPDTASVPADIIVESLQKLYINPDIRGRGIGSKLVTAVEEMATDDGYGRIWLMCYRQNEAAQRLYSRLGWSRCGEMELLMGFVFVRECVYEKALDVVRQ